MPLANCPVCAGDSLASHLPVPQLNFSRRISRGEILRCHDCGAHSLDPFPTPDDIAELYQERGVFSQPSVNPHAGRAFFRQFEYLYRQFADGTRMVAKTCLNMAGGTSPRILDVGCGRGILLDKFRRLCAQADLHGIDLDPGARQNAPAELANRIAVGRIEDISAECQFDIITSQFVIEHILEPVPFLDRLHALLADGGCAMLSTPDIGSRKARTQRAAWDLISRNDMKIGHCIWYDRAAFHRLVEAHGFSVVKIVNRGETIDHLPAAIRRLLVGMLGTDPASGRIIRNYQLRILWAVVMDGFVAERLGWGDNMYFFLRKAAG